MADLAKQNSITSGAWDNFFGVAADVGVVDVDEEVSKMRRPYIIGIAGGTGSGKTTFAQSIISGFQGTGWGSGATTDGVSDDSGDSIAHLCHDHYYNDLSHLSMEERAKTNFDHPDSLDNNLLIHHIQELLEGRSVVVPRYDFSTHSRLEHGEVMDSKRVILVEGILIFSVKSLVKLIDLKIFVDATSDIRLMRRIQRDTLERGRTLSDILSQYSATVRPMHDKFVEPSKCNADFILHSHDEDESVSVKRMENTMRVICNHLKMETR